MDHHPLGFTPDHPDHRDLVLADGDFGAAVDVGIPYSAAATHWLPPVLDQGDDESCILQVLAGLIWAAHRRSGLSAEDCELLARQPPWWLLRRQRGLEAFNVGGKPRTAFRLLNEVGFCREHYHPHDTPRTKPPSPRAAQMSADQRNRGLGRVEYRAIHGEGTDLLNSIRRAIAAGLPVGVGFAIDGDFASRDFRAEGPVVPPAAGDVVGYHYMLVHAYEGDDSTNRNSWGPRWNGGGDVVFSRAYMERALSVWTVVNAPRFSDPA